MNGAVNTEHLKGRSSVSHDEVDMVNSLSEERLEELLAKGSKKELDAICKDCGIEVQLNTKIDCIKALKSAIASSAHIDKFFVKIWHASGGTLSATCPHGIVYMMKGLFKAESTRDTADLLLSMKHPPNIVISDVPHMLAAHTNKRQVDFFNPFGGRVCNPSNENVEKAHNGTLQKQSFSWLDNAKGPCVASNLEGMKKVSQRYSLYDRFHEKNTSQRKEILRSTKWVAELEAINTATAEQLNRSMSKDIYFLSTMTPLHHLQMMRSLQGNHNILKNEQFRGKLLKEFPGIEYGFDMHGRLTLAFQAKMHNRGAPITVEEKTESLECNIFNIDIKREDWYKRLDMSQEIRFERILSSNTGGTLPGDSHLQLPLDALQTAGIDKEVDNRLLDALMLIIAAQSYGKGINATILPSDFFTKIENDALYQIPDLSGNCHCLFVPSLISSHWCLAGFDKRTCKLFYLDSLGEGHMGRHSGIVANHIQIIKNIIWQKILCKPIEEEEHVFSEGWTLVTPENFSSLFKHHFPLQTKGVDCGVLVTLYAFLHQEPGCLLL